MKPNDDMAPLVQRSIQFTVFLLLVVLAATTVRAQDAQRIAAVVNDEVISLYDLVARLDLVVETSGLPNSRELRQDLAPQALEVLIDEKLRLQEATKYGIGVTDEEIERAIEVMERQTNMPSGSFLQFVNARNLDVERALGQIRAQVAWAKLAQQRFSPTIAVGPDEIDAEIARIESERGKPIYRVAEIFLSVESPGEEAKVRADALRLETQLRNGAQFGALAQQFSHSASAAVAGDLGWLQPSQLAPEIAAQITTMEPGSISPPIRTLEGFHILLLIDRAVSGESERAAQQLHLAQVFLPVPQGASASEDRIQEESARSARSSVAGCADLIAEGRRIETSMSGDLGVVELDQLPENLRDVVVALDVGVPSEPVRTASGWHVLMVCEREEPAELTIDRDRVQVELTNRRLERMARRYLRDIRRVAFIEIRL
ncbi:MAG: peptidylprolyl isomerase [Proteobacteria bacterium]|nr:peptidylprolyl isomerase [Pseudomonadota bacterium]